MSKLVHAFQCLYTQDRKKAFDNTAKSEATRDLAKAKAHVSKLLEFDKTRLVTAWWNREAV